MAFPDFRPLLGDLRRAYRPAVHGPGYRPGLPLRGLVGPTAAAGESDQGLNRQSIRKKPSGFQPGRLFYWRFIPFQGFHGRRMGVNVGMDVV